MTCFNYVCPNNSSNRDHDFRVVFQIAEQRLLRAGTAARHVLL